MAHPEWDEPVDQGRAQMLAEALVNEARIKAGLVYPSRLMRILLAVREVALILWLAVGTVLGILALVFLAEFGRALDDRVTPDPTPLPGFTECVGEVC